MSIPVESTFIEFSRLGVLEHKVKRIYDSPSKRTRQSQMREISKILKGLDLADHGRDIYFIGLGVTALGTPGLMIVYGLPEYSHSQVPA